MSTYSKRLKTSPFPQGWWEKKNIIIFQNIENLSLPTRLPPSLPWAPIELRLISPDQSIALYRTLFLFKSFNPHFLQRYSKYPQAGRDVAQRPQGRVGVEPSSGRRWVRRTTGWVGRTEARANRSLYWGPPCSPSVPFLPTPARKAEPASTK